MKLAIDLDGVLADASEIWIPIFQKRFNIQILKNQIIDIYNIEKVEIFFHSLNDNKKNSEDYVAPNEPILTTQIFNENLKNPYLKPKAGLTSISSKTEGALGAIKRTTVEFVVHNKVDFESIFLPFFMKILTL